MGKVSFRKLSVLGLILMGASAVTAAILPDKADNKRISNNNGTLRPESNSIGGPGGVFSCFDDVDTFDSCTATAEVFTTTTHGDEGNSYDTQGDDQVQTTRNTSQTFAIPDGPGGVDQTSHVVVI